MTDQLNKTIKLIDPDIAERASIGALVLMGESSPFISSIENLPQSAFKKGKNREVFLKLKELILEKARYDYQDILSDLDFCEKNKVNENYFLDCVESFKGVSLENDILPTMKRFAQIAKIERKLYTTVIDRDNAEESMGQLRELLDDFEYINQDRQVHYLSDVAEEIETVDQLPPIPTPFWPELQVALKGGLKRTGKYVVVAPSGFGKTSLSVTFAEELAKPFCITRSGERINMGYKVLFIELEMAKEELYWRLLGKMSGVRIDYLQGNTIVPDVMVKDTKGEMRPLRELVKETRIGAKRVFAENYNIKIADTLLDYDVILETVEKQCKMNAVDVVIIDYLGLIEHTDQKIPDWKVPAKFTRALQTLQKKYKFASIELTQYRKGQAEAGFDERGWYGQKSADEIEGGKMIQNSADAIICLYQTKEQKELEKINGFYKTKVMYKLMKNRVGKQIYDVVLDYNRSTASLKEAYENTLKPIID
jgi:replicative DNA helicase